MSHITKDPKYYKSLMELLDNDFRNRHEETLREKIRQCFAQLENFIRDGGEPTNEDISDLLYPYYEQVKNSSDQSLQDAYEKVFGQDENDGVEEILSAIHVAKMMIS